MADNLSITIGADSSKFRAEMALVDAQLRKTQKEMRATADAAAKGDPKALQDLKAQSVVIDTLTKKRAAYNKEINESTKAVRASTAAHKEHAHGFYLVENSVQSLNGALMALGHNLGGGRAGAIGGFVAGIAFTKLIETIDEASKKLTELKKAAGEIGIRPVALQAVQAAAKEAGHDVDAATKVMQGFGKVIEDNRTKLNAPVSVGAGPTVLSAAGTLGTPTPGRIGMPAGPTVRVGRGGQPGLTDPTKALDDLDLSRFAKNAEGIEKAVQAVQQRVLELQKTMNSLDFNIFAKANFGVSGQELGEIVNDMQKLEQIIKRLQGRDPDAFKRNEELLASEGRLAKSFDDATANMMKWATEARVFINNELAQFFDETAFSANLKTMLQQWAYFWGDMRGVAAQAAGAIQTTLSALWGAASSAASNVGQAIAAAPVIPGMAGGGYVRGPGTGTSDSIMARLSAGEFVVNAARVRQVGLGFMQQLNGFAEGGLVGRFPRFAEGGLVGAAAGGGTPVHLHLDGASYAMHAEAGVAEALVVAARRQQMRSAGVRPSWYGGRAGA